MSGIEQRREPRVATQQTVWVEGQDVRVEADARNISRTGMFVLMRDNLPEVGEALRVQFEDPREGQIQVTMEVVWRNEAKLQAELGLRLVDDGGTKAFQRVVTRLLESEEK
jgi:hypothetical protein